MYDQRKEDKCLRIAAFGYEAGLFGAEGRGLYAGGTLAGVHAELSHLEDGPDSRSSWGLQENVYFGIGNNSNDEGLDGKTKSMVKWEIWLPSLGVLGHFTFGRGYDISRAGNVAAQDAYLKAEFGEGYNADLIDDDGVPIYSKERAKKIDMSMKTRYNVDIDEPNSFGNPHNGYKHKYSKSGIWGNYGNVELIYEGGKIYSSFNYANHWWTHLIIDLAGYKWQKL